VGISTWIVVRWAANAARVQNEQAVRKLDEVLLVAMSTQNCPCPNIPEPLLYGGQTGAD